MKGTSELRAGQEQLPLNGGRNASAANVFKQMYYHLYANSQSVRSERIMEDLSKILLARVASDSRPMVAAATSLYLRGEGTANSVLLPRLAEAYPGLISADDRFSIGDRAVRACLQDLGHLDLVSAPAHVLGDAFQALFGPRLRGERGQFFTPRTLARSMVRILGVGQGDKVVDPACGTGGFLAEVYAYCRQAYGADDQTRLLGIDKDADMWRLASSLLTITAGGAAGVLNRDSLDIEGLESLSEDESPFGADLVLTNPPFGAKIGITERRILSRFSLGHEWAHSKSEGAWIETNEVRASQDPQVLFLELCIRLLKDRGRLGIVLPEGVFGNRGAGYIWDFVRKQGRVSALLDCPRTTFQPSTDTKTNVLFFEKTSEVGEPDDSVWVSVALHCGHDRRGRNTDSTGEPLPDDFARLSAEYELKEQQPTGWTRARVTDPYYLVPRYYDSSTDAELKSTVTSLGAGIMSLGELVESRMIEITKGHEVGSEAYGTGDVPFVRTSDIVNFEINSDPTFGVSEEIYEKYGPLQRIRPKDILLVVDGRYRIGSSAMVHEGYAKCVVQSHLRIIKVNESAPFDAYGFFLLLNSREAIHQLRNLVFIQSTLGSLGKRLMELRIPMPSETEAWVERVEAFRESLDSRGASLARLREMTANDLEL